MLCMIGAILSLIQKFIEEVDCCLILILVTSKPVAYWPNV